MRHTTNEAGSPAHAKQFGSSHYKALMMKNYTVWKRNKCGSCSELVVPIFLALFFFIFRGTLSTKDIAEKSYLNEQSPILSRAPTTAAEFASVGMINCWDRSTTDQPDFRNGNVGLISNSNSNSNTLTTITNLKSIMSLYSNASGKSFSFVEYSSLDEFNAYISGDSYNFDICFALDIESDSNHNYNIQLIFNTTSLTDFDIPDTMEDEVLDYKLENKNDFYYPYLNFGSLQIKNWIDNAILQTETGNPNAKIEFQISPLKEPAYTNDTLGDVMKGNISTFTVLPLIVVFLRMTSGILKEKESKIREGMKIMGMKDTSFYLSWITMYFIIYTVISIVVSSILKASLFANSDWTVIFVWHWLFSLTLIPQSLFFTTFFTNAKLGNIAAMVFFLFMYMFQFIINGNSHPSESTNTIISVFSQSAMDISSDVFLLVEAQGTGIGWGNIMKSVTNFRVGSALLLYLVNGFVFMVFALYLDQVIPNDFGKKQHPLFCVSWMCKKRNTLKSNQSQIVNPDEEEGKIKYNDNIEDVPAGLKEQAVQGEALQINDIYRLYPNGKKAVNGVSLTMYKNQIFCLLGHNGAGKTSTIQMLTGMLEFSSGNANVFGKDVETEMESIRQFMGVCPQHDILFPELSVKEHLELFAVFKGMEQKDIPAAVDQAIIDVDLQEKTNELSKNLSGGQKRRLSVAIAFIGGSKLIYLDEPTSGMDTSARRHIWDMLKRYKSEKIIVLTTHFMDEADFLGDRIGIMGEGKLICCGSSVFLKNRFGVGYNLTIVKQSTEADSKPIADIVKQFVPESNKISDVSQEIAFQLPISSVSKFEQLFTTLDSQKDKLKISSYGISITTLEEVFLKVAHINSASDSSSAVPPEQATIQQPIYYQSSKAEATAKVTPIENHIDPQHAIKNSSEHAIIIHNQEEKSNKLSANSLSDNFDLNSVRVKQPFQLFLTHFKSLIVKRALYFTRDKRGFICEVFLPCIMVVGGLSLLLISFITDSPKLQITNDFYGNDLNLYFGADSSVSSSDMSSLMSHLSPSIVATALSTANVVDWENSNFNDRNLNRKGAYWMNSFSPSTPEYNYYVQVQTISRSSPLYFTNQMNQAIIRHASSKNVNINIANYPIKMTKRSMEVKGSADGIVASFMFSIGLSFIPASLITFIVKERVDMVKHQHFVSGVSLISYWAANFTIDILKHLIPTVFCILMVLAYNIKTFTNHDSDFTAISIMFFLYGWSIIPFSYLTSFIFADYGSAQVTNFFIHFIFGGIIPLTVFILRLIQSTHSVGLALGWIFRFIPSFAFGYGVLNVGSRSFYSQVDKVDVVYGTYDLNIAGGDIIFMSIGGIVYFILVFIYESLSHKKGFSEMLSGENKIAYQNQEYDDDVQKEIDTIEKSSPSDYTVRVKDLRKVFVPAKDRVKVAVDRVSFGIKQGEVFTLLGVNGAGKTTTFKVLSGEIQPTSGETHIAGYSVQNQLSQARNNIGYCPQFDALLENLTAREHLNLYAAIKGIPGHLRNGLVEKKLVEMDLKKFEGILAGTFSGGNKRKLSVAIAMLGQPSIVFLDEPSTGMDPAARRFMWDVISRISTVNKSSSILMTTHSMEEAEALSTRVAIQVEGTLQCIGTIQEIKNKFGKGYEVEIKIKKPTIEEIQELHKKAVLKQNGEATITQINSMSALQKILQNLKCTELSDNFSDSGNASVLYRDLISQRGLKIDLLLEYISIEASGKAIMDFIVQKLGKYEVIEHFSDFYRFRIETAVSIGQIFGQFEATKLQLRISEYSLKQATIEQIFNMFAEGKIRVNQHLHENPTKQNQELTVVPIQRNPQLQSENRNQIQMQILNNDQTDKFQGRVE